MSVCSLKKIRSETGASLSFALLLVLVCATAGGVILAAGTVASGRLSRRTEMDQRYYTVVSALDFLRGEIADKKVSIERKKTLIEKEVRTVNFETGADSTVCNWTVTYETYINKNPEGITEVLTDSKTAGPANEEPRIEKAGGCGIILGSASFLTKQAIDLMFGTDSPTCNTTEAMEQYSFSSGFPKDNDVISLESNSIGGLDGVTTEDLKVSGYVNLKSNGNMELLLRSGSNSGSDAYRLGLTMIAETDETDDENITTDVQEIANGPETQTTTITTTVTTKHSTIKWTPGGIVKWTEPVGP